MTDLCAIATSKPWNIKFPGNLHTSTGHKFQIVSNPTEITLERLTELGPRYVFSRIGHIVSLLMCLNNLNALFFT
jgi:hypothetical protein